MQEKWEQCSDREIELPQGQQSNQDCLLLCLDILIHGDYGGDRAHDDHVHVPTDPHGLGGDGVIHSSLKLAA